MRVEWRGKPVWVVRRAKSVLDSLDSLDDQLRDPASQEGNNRYAQNEYRSIKAEFFVAVYLYSLGLSPTYTDSFGEQVQGVKSGFLPICGSKFDMAGRSFRECLPH